jgi:hypothetical protein
MIRKIASLTRPLHLDDADSIPDQIEKPSMLRVLETSYLSALGPEASN